MAAVKMKSEPDELQSMRLILLFRKRLGKLLDLPLGQNAFEFTVQGLQSRSRQWALKTQDKLVIDVAAGMVIPVKIRDHPHGFSRIVRVKNHAQIIRIDHAPSRQFLF